MPKPVLVGSVVAALLSVSVMLPTGVQPPEQRTGSENVIVSDVAPTAQVTDLFNVMRDDAVRPSLPREDVLANAPDQRDGMFRVKAIFEE